MKIRIRSHKKLLLSALLALLGTIAVYFGVRGALDQVELLPDEARAVDSVQTSSAREAFEHVGGVRLPGNEHTNTPATEHGRFLLVARRPDGTIRWTEDITNALTYAGQQAILKCYFTATGCPTAGAHYVGLATATPSQTTTLATVAEMSGTGYARANVASWTCTSNASSNNNCAATQETWTAGSDWPALTSCFISDASSGTAGLLLSFAAFAATRDLASGDTLKVDYSLTLQ